MINKFKIIPKIFILKIKKILETFLCATSSGKSPYFRLSLKDGITPEFFFIICKIFHHGIFYQKLKSASDREFYSLYDAKHEFTKFEFS
jgi:hypothetical protein